MNKVTPIKEQGRLSANEAVGSGLFVMRIEAPNIAQSVLPGQFVHMQVPNIEAHILRRPFSIYTTAFEQGSFEILYQVLGFATEHMTSLVAGDAVDLIGPIGSPWNPPKILERALLVAGGVGAAPLFMLAEHLLKRNVAVDVILGAQTKTALVCYECYQGLTENVSQAEYSLRCATDDGSFGYAGFCTALSAEALATQSYDYAAICGPEPMIKQAAKQALLAKVFCEVSLERRMACGIGACLSCVVDTTEGKKRACVDGPVFDAQKVVFS